MVNYQRIIAEINLDNIAHNMNEIRKKIGLDTKIMAVVKADGYGHGAVETAKVCLYNGADYLGIAMVDEGVQLRENNIHVPALILGYTPEAQIEDAVKYDLTQTVFSYETAVKISRAAAKIGKTAAVHIKLDTGMGRIGFDCTKKSIQEILKINELEDVKITGIFTHFSTSDEKDKGYTNMQYQKFDSMCSQLEASGISGIIRHSANSGAILDMPGLKCDMVRAGIIIYGMYPSGEVTKSIELKPAMSLKTHLSFLKELAAGESISYGRTYTTTSKTAVATIPAGYADGYARIMSNKARVIINGHYAPIIGNICMDQCMCDVSGIPDVHIGSEAILLGKSGGCEITAEELAEIQQTINYEVVCAIGKRVPRIYTKNGKIIKTMTAF